MKGNLKIILIVIGIVVVAALLLLITKRTKESPEAVAKNFLDAVASRNYAKARNYGTQETGKFIDMIESLEKISSGETQHEKKKYEIISHEENEATAVVTYREESDTTDQFINLVKIGDEWKVSVSKTDLSNKKSSGFDVSGFAEDDSMNVEISADTLEDNS